MSDHQTFHRRFVSFDERDPEITRAFAELALKVKDEKPKWGARRVADQLREETGFSIDNMITPFVAAAAMVRYPALDGYFKVADVVMELTRAHEGGDRPSAADEFVDDVPSREVSSEEFHEAIAELPKVYKKNKGAKDEPTPAEEPAKWPRVVVPAHESDDRELAKPKKKAKQVDSAATPPPEPTPEPIQVVGVAEPNGPDNFADWLADAVERAEEPSEEVKQALAAMTIIDDPAGPEPTPEQREKVAEVARKRKGAKQADKTKASQTKHVPGQLAITDPDTGKAIAEVPEPPAPKDAPTANTEGLGCCNCGAGPIRAYNRCNACYIFARKRNRERPYITVGEHTLPKAPFVEVPVKTCVNPVCGAAGVSAQDRCHPCYLYYIRHGSKADRPAKLVERMGKRQLARAGK